MAISMLTPAILAGAVAAGLFMAPLAAADARDDLEKSDVASGSSAQRGTAGPNRVARPGPAASPPKAPTVRDVPQAWRNEALWTGSAGPNQFGSLPKPPLIAMD